METINGRILPLTTIFIYLQLESYVPDNFKRVFIINTKYN